MESHSSPIRLLDALARLQGRLRSVFDEARKGSDIGDMEHTVLAAVVEARQPPTVPKIGRALGHPRQVIQRAANGLVARGLIGLVENPDHKRASLLVATEAGKAVQATANSKAEAISARLLEQLDPQQLDDAVGLLEAIRADLDAAARKNPS